MTSYSEPVIRQRAIRTLAPLHNVKSEQFSAVVDAYVEGFRDHQALSNGLIAERDALLLKLDAILKLIGES
jgi:hypothetical protein